MHETQIEWENQMKSQQKQFMKEKKNWEKNQKLALLLPNREYF